MAREPEELVEMRRALGAQLAAFRQAADLTQGQVARTAFVDRTAVTHIEKGRAGGTERFWTLVDQCCRADGALLAGFHALEAARQEHRVRAREAQLADARARVKALRATLVPAPLRDADHLIEQEAIATGVAAAVAELTEAVTGPLAYLACLGSLAGTLTPEQRDHVSDQLATFLREWANSMHRREVLQLLGWAATTVAATPAVTGLNPDEQERLVRATVSPSRVDEQVIDHLAAMLAHCKRQEDALGSRAVLSTALAQRDLIRSLLTDCPTALRPRLLSVYSDISTSIGYYYFDLNDFDSSRYYCDQARAAAHDAGNVDLVIYALCEISDHAAWQGNAAISIEFATAAQSLVAKSEDPLMRVCVAQRSATAYAVDGQHAACMVDFERAEDGLASAGKAPAGSLGYFLHEGYLARMKSECLLRLGKPQGAAASARAGLALYDKSFVDGYAVCTLHLGNAHLQCREIDEAARVLGNAAGLAVKTHSARLAKELRITRTRMQPWQSTQAVKALDDQLAAYGLVTSSSM